MLPIRLGLVGLNFGRTICRELLTKKDCPVQLVSICDKNGDLAESVSQELDIPIVPSLDDLLDDDSIDAVGLYCGPNGRADLIRQIIHAGKDVMTTKPFEIDPNAALAVLHEAKELGRVVHMNSPNPRPFGEMAIIDQWINAGEIGQPTVAQGNVWNYYGPTLPDGSWYDDPIRCPVAPIFRLGIYQINSILPFFGEPKSVQVTYSRVITKRPTPDNASLTIGFQNGGIVNLISSLVVGGPEKYKNTFTIGGTKGVIFYATGPRPRNDEVVEANLMLSTDEKLERRVVNNHAGEYDWDFFAQRIRGEVSEDMTTPEQVVTALRVVKAMSLAEQTGDTISMDEV
ncbi:MAG TPA: Gfo/Idh/MocA family oxidoreductase [Armatimonadota bacterium]|nr:Gfo/Idh/MocA family oxidoreductase [Armatimonadota bacterium]